MSNSAETHLCLWIMYFCSAWGLVSDSERFMRKLQEVHSIILKPPSMCLICVCVSADKGMVCVWTRKLPFCSPFRCLPPKKNTLLRSKHLKQNPQSKSSRTHDIPILATRFPVSERGRWEYTAPILWSLTYSKEATTQAHVQKAKNAGCEFVLRWSVDALLDLALCGPPCPSWTAADPRPQSHSDRSESAQFKPTMPFFGEMPSHFMLCCCFLSCQLVCFE